MSVNQCAVGADGNLLPAGLINFYNDPDDTTPISGPGAPQQDALVTNGTPSWYYTTTCSHQ